MSAAATAAGYLYASGRLRGKNSQDHEEKTKPQRRMRVAVVEQEEMPAPQKAKPAPKIQYRTRRVWKPE
jgi:hypothetical protein